MSGKIRSFLKRFLPPSTNVLLSENERLLAEIRSLREELSEHRWEETEGRTNSAAEQELLFDEMTQHVRASQMEIIDGVTLQMQAAEMMRQYHTDQIDRLAQEIAALRGELEVQRNELVALRQELPQCVKNAGCESDPENYDGDPDFKD